MTLTQLFTSIANAIRTKKGTEALIQAEDFADEISTIQTGIDTSDATAEPINIRDGETAYVDGQKITGILPVLTYPINPSRPSDTNYQFIAATSSSKVTRDGTDYLLGTYQIASQSQPDSWMFEGNRKMKLGIPFSMVVSRGSITASKIKAGETIYGVVGTYTGVSADDVILINDIASVNASKSFSLPYTITNTSKVEIKMNAKSNVAWNDILTNGNGYYLEQNSSAYSYTFGYNGSFVSRSISIRWNSTPKVLIFDNNKLYVDGTLLATASGTTFSTGSSLTINGSSPNMDFYYIKIYENGVLKKHYVPATYAIQGGSTQTILWEKIDKQLITTI